MQEPHNFFVLGHASSLMIDTQLYKQNLETKALLLLFKRPAHPPNAKLKVVRGKCDFHTFLREHHLQDPAPRSGNHLCVQAELQKWINSQNYR